MSRDPEQVAALIKELLILNRADSIPTVGTATENEIEGTEVKRIRIRQELVLALHLHDKKKS